MKKLVLTASLVTLCGAALVAVPVHAQTPVAIAPVALAPEQAPPAPRPAAAPAAPRPTQAPRTVPAEPPAAPAQPVPPPASLPNTPQRPAANIRFDVTITDTGGAKPVVKTLSLTVSTANSNGSVRTTAKMPGADPNFPGPAPAGSMMAVPLNVDVRNARWIDSNAILAQISVEYQPYIPDAKSQPGVITASAQSLFYDGRRTQILVASDPVSDRKTTIEVMATIVK